MNNPEQLLPEVMSRVAGLGPVSLQAVHRFLDQIELAALMENIQDEAEILRALGKLEPPELDAVIGEHRRLHPSHFPCCSTSTPVA